MNFDELRKHKESENIVELGEKIILAIHIELFQNICRKMTNRKSDRYGRKAQYHRKL